MMVLHKAQNVAAKPRTEDVQISEDIDFKSMLLPKPILDGLKKSGYIKPSPIQKKALPLVRCGLDLIVQAKAGTGKTCVFTVAALEIVKPNLPHLQAIILAPTREIALQITSVIKAIGQSVEGLKTCCFIGGFPLSTDVKHVKGCHIAVGAPGRMKHLLEKGLLNPHQVRLFVLDEGDKLMEEPFAKDILAIFEQLPDCKQVLACSATYTDELVEFLGRFMNGAQYVSPQQNISPTLLLGVRQFVSIIPHHVDRLAQLKLKEKHLLYLLQSISFNQCLVFSNLHTRAVSLCNLLRGEGWGVEWIAGRQEQKERVAALMQLRDQRVRVLVTTDLTARGIDVENINLVINLDLPMDHHTYLHRMGRAGRYGSHGIVITVVSNGQDLTAFQKLIGRIGGAIQSVNRVPETLKNIDLWTMCDDKFEKVCGIIEKEKSSSTSEKSEEGTTSTGEKYSPESSDSEDYVKEFCGENGVGQKNGTIESAQMISVVSGLPPGFTNLGNRETSRDIFLDNVSATSDKADSSTSTDEKFSRGSSESGDSPDKCDEQGSVTSEYSCVCNLYEADAADIKVIAGPSLFALKKEDTWREVLPVVVNESKVPLNTPIALLNSKLIRVRFWDKTQSSGRNVDLDISSKEIISFETKCDSKDFVSFNDIVSFLENDVEAVEPIGSICENTSKSLLSFANIEDALESGFCEMDGRILVKSNEIEEVLKKYNKIKERAERALISFDSFDLVGWLAVDEQHNIIEEIDIEKCEVFEFNLVTCLAGKNHIEVLSPSKGMSKEAHDRIDHITTLNVEMFPLSAPFSLSNIAQQIGPQVKTENLKQSKNKVMDPTLKEKHTSEIVGSVHKNQNGKCSDSKVKSLLKKLKSKLKVPVVNSSNKKCDTKRNVECELVNEQKKSNSSTSKSLASVSCKKTNVTKCSGIVSTFKGENRVNKVKCFLENNSTSLEEQVRKCDKDDIDYVLFEGLPASLPSELQQQRSGESDDSGPHVDMTWNLTKYEHNLEDTEIASSFNKSELQPRLSCNKHIPLEETFGAKSKNIYQNKSKSQDKNEFHNGFEHTRKHRNSDDSYDSFDTVEYETTDLDKERFHKLFCETGTQRRQHHTKHQDSTNDSLKESYDSHEYPHKNKLTKGKVLHSKPHKQERSKHLDSWHKQSHKESHDTYSSFDSEGTKPHLKFATKVQSKKDQKNRNKSRQEARHKLLPSDTQESYRESYDSYNSIESEITKLKELNSKLHKQDKAARRHRSEIRHKQCFQKSEDEDESVGSEGTNRHSFRTACSEHYCEGHHHLHGYVTSNRSSRLSNHAYESPAEIALQEHYSHPGVTGYSARQQFDQHSTQGNEEPEEESPGEQELTQNDYSHYPYGSYDYNPNEYHQYSNYQYGDYSNNLERDPTKIIKGINLHEEWYSKWYLQVRQRATQLAMMEYINMMSTP